MQPFRFKNSACHIIIVLCVLSIVSIVIQGELTCPRGWRLYYRGEKCVMIINRALSWSDARKYCQQGGGDLFTVKDAATNSFLDGLHKKHRVTAWIGAHRVKKDFVWLDESRKLQYNNWDSSSARTKGSQLDCVSLAGSSTRWKKLKCTARASFVCSQDAFHNARAICTAGWSPFKRNCYKLFKPAKTWMDARSYCKRQRGRLVTIQDKPTDEFLKTKFLKKDLNTWIGLNDWDKEGTYMWADTKSKLGKFNGWLRGQPNNYQNTQNCVHYFQGHNRKWADSNCKIKFQFICQKGSFNKDLNCPNGWDLNLKYKTCIRRLQTKRTWSDARTVCKRMKSDLVQIPDAAFNSYIKGRLGSSNNYYWTGLHQLPNSQQFRWLDVTNKAPTYTIFGGTSNVAGKQNCVAVLRTKSQWQKLDCNSKNYFFCQRATYASVECPAGYTIYKRTRSCVRFSKDTLEWEKARQVCQKDGGDLLKIDSRVLNDFIITLVKKDKARYWIGLHDRQKENDFHWGDSTNALRFKYWAKGEPNNKNNNQNCVNINGLKNNYWMDGNCLIQRRYICQHPATIHDRTPKQPKVDLHCPSRWSQYTAGKTCIKYFSNTKTWADARTDCHMQSGDLVTIADKDFNLFVNTMLGKVKAKGEPYIGFNDIKSTGKYRWLDETIDRKYDNWHQGEPSNGKENCALIVVDPAYHYEWNDVPCSSKKPYICQKSALIAGSPNCGDGWEDSPESDYCYRINSEPLTWDDAQGSCKLYGGNLVSIVSAEEMLYLNGRIQSLKVDSLWSGGNDIDYESGWRWVDKQPFPFFNWDNQAPRQNDSLNCISITKDTGRWMVDYCLNRYPSICKKLGKEINHPTPKPTSKVTNLPNNKFWGCYKGWKSYRGSCYLPLYAKNGINWKDANDNCKRHSSDLVAITDFYENRFVFSLIPGGKEAWIGFNALKRKFSFTWSDGITPVTYTRWMHGQPNFYTSDEYCSTMNPLGKWFDRSCSSSMNYLVCKKNKQIRDKSVMQKFKGCDKSGKGYQAKCYIFYATAMTFDKAEKYCQTKGGHLATVSDRYVQAFLTSELTLNGYNFWIGLSNTKQSTVGSSTPKYVYSWTSGSSLYFTHWDRAHSGSETNTCVGMKSKRPTGLWHNYPCNVKQPFICEYPRVGFTTPKPVPTTPNLAPCPSDWVAIGRLCYKEFVATSRLKKNWMDAKSACESVVSGGTLASITSEGLSSRLTTEFKKGKSRFQTFKDSWIGLNDRDLEGGYKWVDGQPYIYTQWSHGEPNNFDNRENCVVWKLASGKWNDQSCYKLNNYICQAPRGSQLYTTLAPISIGSTVTQCGAGEWTMYNGYCYIVVSQYFDRKDWFGAKDYCASKGAHLVSIMDSRENNYITILINKKSLSSIWIGLNDFDGDVYKWTDGAKAYYFDWLPGEPNDNYLGERCVELIKNGGWNDMKCQKKNGFVCKKRPGNFSPLTTVQPTIPTGGCPANFSGAPETSQCFYVGGLKQGDRKSFMDAIKACKNVLDKARLASIHSDEDEDFITTLLAGSPLPAWIGLRKQYSNWNWADNTRRNYVHWGKGQPENYYSYRYVRKYCADMMITPRSAGYWASFNCRNKLPYVCAYRKDPAFHVNKPKTDNCLNGYQRFRQSCYKYFAIPQTWSQSETTCINDGGHLIGISGRFEQSFVNLVMSNQATPQIWIGLSDSSEKNSFTWSNGWPMLQTFWVRKQPDLSKQCVVHARGQGWSTKYCQINMPFICEIHDNPPPVATVVPGKCPSNIWTQYGEYCYYVEGKQLKSWPEANYMCQSLGGNLASIHSASDAQIIYNFLSIDQLDAWIGLQKSGPGSFKWSDGSATSYFKWAIGSPASTNSTKNQACVLAQGLNGNWTDISCFVNHGYVCKVKQIPLVLPTTSTTTTTSTTPKSTSTSTSTPRVVTHVKLQKPRKATKRVTSQPPPTNPSRQANQQSAQSPQSSGLKAGGISGIVIGVIAVLAIVILGVFFMKKRPLTATPSSAVIGFDNAVYQASQEENPSIQFSYSS